MNTYFDLHQLLFGYAVGSLVWVDPYGQNLGSLG